MLIWKSPYKERNIETPIQPKITARKFYIYTENCFTEMPTGRKSNNFKNYAFITVFLNGVTFQDMRLKVQEKRRSNTSFNERKNISLLSKEL